jgi:hypothetical protein
MPIQYVPGAIAARLKWRERARVTRYAREWEGLAGHAGRTGPRSADLETTASPGVLPGEGRPRSEFV